MQLAERLWLIRKKKPNPKVKYFFDHYFSIVFNDESLFPTSWYLADDALTSTQQNLIKEAHGKIFTSRWDIESMFEKITTPKADSSAQLDEKSSLRKGPR